MLIEIVTHLASASGVFNPGDVADIKQAEAEEYVRLGYAVLVENKPLEPLKSVSNQTKRSK